MDLGKYYIEQEIRGTIYGKGKEGREAVYPPREYFSEKAGGYYVSMEEEDDYQEKLNRLKGFDTIEEAEEAAQDFIKKRIPFIVITRFLQWDELSTYTQRVKYLTDAYGQKPKEDKQ